MILEQGEYEIPEDCIAKVHHRMIYIAPKQRRGRRFGSKKEGRAKHCRDCRHREQGYAANTACHKTMVCKLRPKIVMGWHKKRETYYAVGEYDPICKEFDEK
jgi:hypothetical protein